VRVDNGLRNRPDTAKFDMMSKNVRIIEALTEARGNVVREVWRVPVDGQIKTLVTSNSSTAIMDEAVVIYNNALKRLADR
jgi:hypothetical protein